MRCISVVLILFFSTPAFALEIKSEAFEKGGYINSEYTCEAEDISPALSWSDVPVGTKSFALICDDPDAPAKSWSHWVIFNIPADKANLAKDIPKIGRFDDGTIQGLNDFGKVGYGGPCPPPGRAHRYFFKLYALDTNLLLYENATKDDCLEAIKGHIIAEAETFGVYKK